MADEYWNHISNWIVELEAAEKKLNILNYTYNMNQAVIIYL